ncbi:MAG: hypothetical protein L3J16_04670, partial [Anaerolineales bacterium]|nr:hypothetical protein [Anaerolineales bacterium]
SRQDREAAHRWNLANEIRRENISVRDKLIKYFKKKYRPGNYRRRTEIFSERSFGMGEKSS